MELKIAWNYFWDLVEQKLLCDQCIYYLRDFSFLLVQRFGFACLLCFAYVVAIFQIVIPNM